MFARKLLLGAVPLALVASLTTAPPSVALTTQGHVDWATSFVADKQDPDGHFPSTFGSAHAATADAVVSLVAAGQGGEEVEAAIGWLEENASTIDSVGKKAKVVMAAVAAGRSPRFFGPDNVPLVEDLQRLANEGEPDVYDSSPFSQVYDQALVILALAAADANVPRDSVRWLADAQCPDGGWQFDLPHQPGENGRCFDADSDTEYTQSDTNTTALVLQALAAVPRSVPVDKDPFEWLRARRDRVKGGWGFNREFSLTDSASTATVIQAYVANRRTPPKAALQALKGLQRYCNTGTGGFSVGWFKTKAGRYKREPGEDLGNTVVAMLGLLREPLPVEPQPYLKRTPNALPCDPID